MSLVTRGLGVGTLVVTAGLGQSGFLVVVAGTILNFALNLVTLGTYSVDLSTETNKAFNIVTVKSQAYNLTTLKTAALNVVSTITKTIERK